MILTHRNERTETGIWRSFTDNFKLSLSPLALMLQFRYRFSFSTCYTLNFEKAPHVLFSLLFETFHPDCCKLFDSHKFHFILISN